MMYARKKREKLCSMRDEERELIRSLKTWVVAR
jgi:hypothetical protein